MNYGSIFSGKLTIQWGKQHGLGGNMFKVKSSSATNFLGGSSFLLGVHAFQLGLYWLDDVLKHDESS